MFFIFGHFYFVLCVFHDSSRDEEIDLLVFVSRYVDLPYMVNVLFSLVLKFGIDIDIWY